MPAPDSPRLIDQTRRYLRVHHYSLQTERTYLHWIKRYVHFHKMESRDHLLPAESKIEAFLSHLAINANVAPATQNQAMNALVFLYKKVLALPLTERIDALRSHRNPHIPVVLTRDEIARLLPIIRGVSQLIVNLLYGSGLRISEALRLRVKDIDFGYKQITVRAGKGNKERVTPLPTSLIPTLHDQLNRARAIHRHDLSLGFGEVFLPHALARKYPNAGHEWTWQYAFPSKNRSTDPLSGVTRRHHIDPSVVTRAVRVAVRQAGIPKRITLHTFRHSFATHLLQRGTDIRTIQALLGHNDLKTTMMYTHILQQGSLGVRSPLDDM